MTTHGRTRRTGPTLPTGWRRLTAICTRIDCRHMREQHMFGSKKCDFVLIKSEISGKVDLLTKAEFKVGRGRH